MCSVCTHKSVGLYPCQRRHLCTAQGLARDSQAGNHQPLSYVTDTPEEPPPPSSTYPGRHQHSTKSIYTLLAGTVTGQPSAASAFHRHHNRRACLRSTGGTCRKAHLHYTQASHQQPLSCASVKEQADHIKSCAVPRGALQTPIPCVVQALPICKAAHSCESLGGVLRGAQHKPVPCAALALSI